jgi:hypothetical protein
MVLCRSSSSWQCAVVRMLDNASSIYCDWCLDGTTVHLVHVELVSAHTFVLSLGVDRLQQPLCILSKNSNLSSNGAIVQWIAVLL